MNPIVLLILAFAPGAFWLWFFARKDVYRPEPRRLIALTFFLGMLSTVPAVLVEALFIDERVLSEQASVSSVAMAMLFVVGPAEECWQPAKVGHFETREIRDRERAW